MANEYEKTEYAKLQTVITAALQNSGAHKKITISTSGANPSASVTLEASMFRKFITDNF